MGENRHQPPKADISRWAPPAPTDVGVRAAYFETSAGRWYIQTVRGMRVGFGKYALCYSAIRKDRLPENPLCSRALGFPRNRNLNPQDSATRGDHAGEKR